MMGNQPWEDHIVLPELQENLEELFPGLTLEEALQHQISLYQSLNVSRVDQLARSSDNEPSSSHGHSWGGHSWGESSFSGSGEYDLALDEALARSLQELDVEDEGDHVAISEPLHTASRNTEHAVAAAAADTSIPQADTYQDDIDPDEMTYEELQSLEEAIGNETQGLSKREISSLPRHTLNFGWLFPKKIDFGECVICCTEYKNRDSVMTLPCAHRYHELCIEPWLVRKKTCPICKEEVKFD